MNLASPSSAAAARPRDRWLLPLAFGVHALLGCIAVTAPLTDCHGFRQTQTALTAAYLQQEGFRLDYVTPVLGAPWTIPFEFPLYQWLVAQFAQSTGMPLDPAGRIVSLLAFYGCIAVVLRWRDFMPEFPSRLTAGLMLVNPVYLFWSRTFLIESTALLFGLLWIYSALGLSTGRWRYLAPLLGFGLLGSLVKITTFGVCLAASVGLVWWRWRRSTNTPRAGLAHLAAAAAVLAAIGATQAGGQEFCDSAKLQSRLGSLLTSAALTRWNFGTPAQRFCLRSWEGVLKHSAFWLPTALGFAVARATVWRKQPGTGGLFTVLLLAGLSGPLVFWNLYSVHAYYHYATNLFLVAAVAVALVRFQSAAHRRTTLLLLVGGSLGYYAYYYFPRQALRPVDPVVAIAHHLQHATRPDDVVLVIGRDWSSEIPYYSGRKCVCVPERMVGELRRDPLGFLRTLNTPGIRHVLLLGRHLADGRAAYLDALASQLALHPVPPRSGAGHLLLSPAPAADPAVARQPAALQGDDEGRAHSPEIATIAQ